MLFLKNNYITGKYIALKIDHISRLLGVQ